MTLTVLSTLPACVSSPSPFHRIPELLSPSMGCDGNSFAGDAPHISPTTLQHLSPLCPSDVPVKGQGLERERFEMLLKVSRERAMFLGHKRSPDLRKEVAVKTHRSKQVECRARFLLKIQQPPSPTAANLPKTPPDSPTVLHYSMPSPGLVSPMEMYEQLEDGDCVTPKSWIEQVDFRLPVDCLPPVSKSIPHKSTLPSNLRSSNGKKLPSLDQISARLTTKHMFGSHEVPHRTFVQLQSERPQRKESPPPITVGRLQMPGARLRSHSPPAAEQVYPVPPSPKTPELVVTTTLVPRTVPSARNLTEANVQAFSRADMLKTLRRRSQPERQMILNETNDAEERSRRRRSAPGEMLIRERPEFKHPVLNLRGGF